MSKDFQNGVALGLAMGGVVEVEIPAKEEQEKSITITENGTTEILPDENKALSKVTVVTDVSGGGGIEPLDNTVTFTVDGEPYEIVSVKSGNSVNAPATEPIKENNVFKGWLTSEEATVTFPYKPTSDIELNAKLTALQYIESSGTQYINTGIIPTNHRVKAKMQLLKTSASAIGLFGVMGSDYSNCYGISYYNNEWYYYAGDRHITTDFAYNDLIEFDLNNENNEFVVNGEVIGTVNGTCSTNYSMPIFARTDTTSASIQGGSQSNARLYYFQIYDKSTNELVRDFVPAIDENGVICLYDKVTETYFYNKGSGTFKTN